MSMEIWQFVLYLILALIVGLAAGFFGARYIIKKQMQNDADRVFGTLDGGW